MTPYQHECTGKIIGSESHPGGRWFKIPDRRGGQEAPTVWAKVPYKRKAKTNDIFLYGKRG